MQNRKIEFRGKRIDTGEWVTGGYIKDVADNPRIIVLDIENKEPLFYGVIPETVGQNTDAVDSEKLHLYENDIIRIKQYKRPFIIYYSNGGFRIKNFGQYAVDYFTLQYVIDNNFIFTIIGNTIDNPELLKQ